MRVALFTPLPPARTGTADYAAALIPALQRLVKLTVYDKVPAIFRRGRFDEVVYQIGNNPFHADIYRMALREPGIVVLRTRTMMMPKSPYPRQPGLRAATFL